MWSTIFVAALLLAGDPEKGRKALEGQAFTPSGWSLKSYDTIWKQWDNQKDPPADYAKTFNDYYGLHPAPYENGRFPMGLREGPGLLFGKGLTTDCLLCHGGSILGKSYVGLGNSTIDIEALFKDLSRASGGPGKLPFVFGQTRGTTEAGAMAVYLFKFRDPDLKVRITPHDFALNDEMIEDPPAWWLLKKKKTMYATGSSDARSVRSIMQFMLSPLNGSDVFKREEQTFRDIQAYLLSLEAPKYPLAIDHDLAAKGEGLFRDNCAKCHGTYGKEPTYPNKIVPLDVIGTDRNRFVGIPVALKDFYNRSWFAQETGDGYQVKPDQGYQAPPLDGVWATAPYLHNGSIPTLWDVLDSKNRPNRFTRDYRTDRESYDDIKVGWKTREVESDWAKTPRHQRHVYDTTKPGRSNQGHTFGDRLSAEERRAVVEYLKTL